MNKSFKEIEDNINKPLKEGIKLFKTGNENRRNMRKHRLREMKNLEIWAGTFEARFTNGKKEMEDKITDIEITIKEMETFYKENVNS